MAARRVAAPTVVVDGRSFRLGGAKFPVKGVTYGPFAPGDDGTHFAGPEQTARDLAGIRDLGANTVRVYEVPPRWVLDLAVQHELRLLIDVPWPKDVCFLDSDKVKAAVRQAVFRAVSGCKQHPGVFGFCLANEIPAQIVRWSGARVVAAFLDELVSIAKAADPSCLCTFASFPPTEYLLPQNLDFLCFNVLLHERPAFAAYLARLQMIAGTKPLVIGECGVDSLREGEPRQAAILGELIEAGFRSGAAGMVIFSYTDDWHRGGQQVTDRAFGLTTRRRARRAAYETMQKAFALAPLFPLPRQPKVSIVVVCFNGERTLKACLESLLGQTYPDCEVILVDDGSTDATPAIARAFLAVRYVRQPNLGLSIARNTGVAAATGEIVAFTDADCRADEHWVHHLVAGLLADDFVGIGGHNLLPPDDSAVAAAVFVSPGGPTHVMLTDREAEHIPGCNMAFFKRALGEVGGFDPVFRKAGDDVDLGWRLQQRGHKLGFSPGGFVWHHRRSTVREYLRQQAGYGDAEALLVRKHPEHYNLLGGGLWRGRIYSAGEPGVLLRRPLIYGGRFGSGPFQRLYATTPAALLLAVTSLEYHVLLTLPLLALALVVPLLAPLAAVVLLVPLCVGVLAAIQVELPATPRAWWSRPLVGLLFLAQPVVRGWARYRERLTARSLRPTTFRRPLPPEPPYRWRPTRPRSLQFVGSADRYRFLESLMGKLEKEGWQWHADAGWENYDVEIYGRRWARVRVTTAAEDHGGGVRLIRCRLRTLWSLLARLAFGAATAVVCLLGLWIGRRWPWTWLLLATLPVLVLAVEREKHTLQRLLAALVTEAAHGLGLADAVSASSVRAPAGRTAGGATS